MDRNHGGVLRVLRAYGRTVAVTLPRSVEPLLNERLPPAYRPSDRAPERVFAVEEAAPGGWLVTSGGEAVGVSASLREAAMVMLSTLELWVAEHARGRIFVHAGCVVHDGRAIVVPGRSMSGKSSLTAALVRAGATYFSDEYAVLDSHGLVHPYPRRLSIRPYGGGTPVHVHAEEYGAHVRRGTAPVGLVVALRYDPDAGWAPQDLSRGEAVLHLVDNTVAAQSRPRAMLTALTAATEQAIALTGTRGDADETAARLLARLEGH